MFFASVHKKKFARSCTNKVRLTDPLTMMRLLLLIVLCGLIEYCESKAGFLTNVPLNGEEVAAVTPAVLPANYPDFDADSKIPGRHVPRLPYHHLPQHVFYQQEEHLQNHPSRSHHNPYPQLDHQSTSNTNTQDTSLHQHLRRHHHHHHHQHSASVGHELEELREEPQDFPITRRSNRNRHSYALGSSVSVDNGPRALGVVATGAGGSNTDNDSTQVNSQRGGGHYGGGGRGEQRSGVGGHGGGGDYTLFQQGSQDIKETYKGPSTPPRPKFDLSLPRNITVQRGKTAVLSCRVLNQGDKSVSWIRSDSLAILAVDKYKYNTDHRLSVVYNEPNLEWVLRIRGVRTNDSGVYECQVSTKPVISFLVNMSVVDPVTVAPRVPYPKMRDQQQFMEPVLVKTEIVPRATIINGPEIFVHLGSLINLTCLVTHGTRNPVFVYWYHHNQVIDYNWRSGVTVTTKQARDTTSHLQVTHAQLNDSGKYICRPNHGEEASVRLHVLSGEYQAAMQTNTSTRISWIPAMFILGTCIGALFSMCTCPPHS